MAVNPNLFQARGNEPGDQSIRSACGASIQWTRGRRCGGFGGIQGQDVQGAAVAAARFLLAVADSGGRHRADRRCRMRFDPLFRSH